jgi:hypothetical protein
MALQGYSTYAFVTLSIFDDCLKTHETQWHQNIDLLGPLVNFRDIYALNCLFSVHNPKLTRKSYLAFCIWALEFMQYYRV